MKTAMEMPEYDSRKAKAPFLLCKNYAFTLQELCFCPMKTPLLEAENTTFAVLFQGFLMSRIFKSLIQSML